MKKVSLSTKIIMLFLGLYAITYNYFLDLGISSNIYNVLFWIVLLLISYFLLGYTKNRAITKKQSIRYVLIYCMIYFILIYFLGIITGFKYTAYSHSIVNIVKNISVPLVIIVCKELIRYMLIFRSRFSKKNILIINAIYIMIDILTVISMYSFNTGLLVFTFIGEVIVRSIYNNSLETIISYNVGPIPSIIYRMILELYVYIVFFVPDLGDYLGIVIDIFLPVGLILCLNKLHYVYQNVTKKKVSISKMYISIPILIILLFLAFLVSGIFKYKIIAVASNSMKPTFARGDAVIYEKVNDINDVLVGDVLVFKNEDTVYIHRVVEIVYKNKEYMIYTKGDNNASYDSFVSSDKDIVGVVKQEIKYIGYPTVWLSEAMG